MEGEGVMRYDRVRVLVVGALEAAESVGVGVDEVVARTEHHN